MEPMFLLTTLDQNYLPQLQVLLTSLSVNNPGETFALFLLHSTIPDDALAAVQRQCDSYGYAFSPIRVDDSLFREAPVTRQYPKEMYYRLLAPRLLPEHIQRVIYLDPDTLVINPIRPLWETDMKGCMFAAAAHTGKTELANNVNRLRLGTDHDYYNSGVLLMDLRRCREEISPGELFDFVREHRHELFMPDQDLLNAMYGDRILPLNDAVWNYDARNYNNYMLRSAGEQNARWVMDNTAILHYCGKAKPWKPNYIYRFGMLYLHYTSLSRRQWTQV